ncbi:MAG: FKBP-type peptidyl-prolyl cis-trans isomerase [Proteobacteria bacterium]|nr:FKBP-type peptidyl-prolyl cis-trans isomerase [Pseudomonadota bacterium]MBU1736659.1 FKBP-type peptidyl-prolyl cis-trans isomerase [Pseudomonadota bacterium]
MKKRIILASILMIIPVMSGCGQQADKSEKNIELKSFDDKVSYVLGLDIGTSLRETGTKIDLATFYRGIEDSLNEKKILMEEADIESTKRDFSKKIQQEYEAKMKGLADKNLEEGKAFFAANKDKEGVVVTESGLQYKVLVKGDGATPKATDQVKVHYRGKLLNGKEFDSSYKRDQPAAFRVNGVIRGWTEVLQLMPVGSKYEVYIPSDLAYGDREVGPDIGPNAALVFEVELLGIE